MLLPQYRKEKMSYVCGEFFRETRILSIIFIFFSLTKSLRSNRESSDFRICSKHREPQTSLQLCFLISNGSEKHFGKETTEIILKQVLDAHVKALFFFICSNFIANIITFIATLKDWANK